MCDRTIAFPTAFAGSRSTAACSADSPADKQLLCLLGWRARTKDPGTLKVLLWIDGFLIPLQDVRSALIGGLEAMLAVIETTLTSHIERQGLDPADRGARGAALAHFSGVFAAKRGPNALPRRARVAASDRAQAIEVVLKLFALGEHVDAAPGEADTVERVLGVAPSGRHDTVFDTGPWLTGPAEALFDAAEIVALPKGLDAARASTDEDLELARTITAALLRYLPLMARLIGAVFDDENHAGFAGLSEFDRQPEFAMLLVPMVVSMLRAGWQENLQSVAAAFEPMPHIADQAHRI